MNEGSRCSYCLLEFRTPNHPNLNVKTMHSHSIAAFWKDIAYHIFFSNISNVGRGGERGK